MFTEEWPPVDPAKRMANAIPGNPPMTQIPFLDTNTLPVQLPLSAPPNMQNQLQYSGQGLHQPLQHNVVPNGPHSGGFPVHPQNQTQNHQNSQVYQFPLPNAKQEQLQAPLPLHQHPQGPENHDFSQYNYSLQAPGFWQKQAYEYAPDGPAAVTSDSISYPRNPTSFSNSFPEGHDSTLIDKLQLLLPQPPLAKVPLLPDCASLDPAKRVKRKSKFTPEQGRLILSLKRKGHSWVEIADITNVGSYLAARNRYQVIVGQQGPNNLASWSQEKRLYLQSLLDAAELYKWEFIAQRLSRSTGKAFTSRACRELVRYLLFLDPESFGVSHRTVDDLERELEVSNKKRKMAS